MAAIYQDRLAITALITAEREAALAGASEQRVALQAGVDALAKRFIEDAFGRTRSLVDYVFVRALTLLVASALVYAVAYRVARGGRRRGAETE